MDRDIASKSRDDGPSVNEQEIDQCSHNATHGSGEHSCTQIDAQNAMPKGDCEEPINQALFNGIGSQFTEKEHQSNHASLISKPLDI